MEKLAGKGTVRDTHKKSRVQLLTITLHFISYYLKYAPIYITQIL